MGTQQNDPIVISSSSSATELEDISHDVPVSVVEGAIQGPSSDVKPKRRRRTHLTHRHRRRIRRLKYIREVASREHSNSVIEVETEDAPVDSHQNSPVEPLPPSASSTEDSTSPSQDAPQNAAEVAIQQPTFDPQVKPKIKRRSRVDLGRARRLKNKLKAREKRKAVLLMRSNSAVVVNTEDAQVNPEPGSSAAPTYGAHRDVSILRKRVKRLRSRLSRLAPIEESISTVVRESIGLTDGGGLVSLDEDEMPDSYDDWNVIYEELTEQEIRELGL